VSVELSAALDGTDEKSGMLLAFAALASLIAFAVLAVLVCRRWLAGRGKHLSSSHASSVV